jgi:hypothetical protein
MAKVFRTNAEKAQEKALAWERLFDLEAIEALLRHAAAQGRALSYAETLGQLGYHFSRPKMRALCAALSAVDARAAARREPELAVLVVRASDGLPGAGWWAGRRDWDGLWDGPAAAAHIHSIQQKAFDYWRLENRN